MSCEDLIKKVYKRVRQNCRKNYASNIVCKELYPIPQNLLTYSTKVAKNPQHDLDSDLEVCKIREKLQQTISKENYAYIFHSLLWLEEIEARQNLKKCKLFCVRLNKRNHQYCFKLPGLKNCGLRYMGCESQSIRDGDEMLPLIKISLFAGSMLLIEDVENGRFINERIDYIEKNIVYFTSHVDQLETRPCNIDFKLSRNIFVRLHEAIDDVLNYSNLFIFPQDTYQSEPVTPITRFINTNISKNYEQKQAVNCIVNGWFGETPFILLGPPGTGKTATIVEAIQQLVIRDSRNNILVCAHSNAAVDNVATFLLKFMPEDPIQKLPFNNFLRIYSKNCTKIPENLKPFSKIGPVDYNVIMKHRIILCTLCHAASYDLSFITHIVIDEASQTSEPSCLLPIHKVQSCKLILSGDHHQLGPVVVSKEAKKYGLELSLMERLIKECPIYSANDNKYMVMLRNNYRSDAQILSLPNKEFYDGKLRALADKDVLSYINILEDIISSNCRAIEFHGVFSAETKVGQPPSYYNKDEFEIVKQYVTKLLSKYHVEEKDLAIIAPYNAQVAVIKDWICKCALQVDVNTVDAFQGQEKRVIIITTVRGQGESRNNLGLGFVKDVKRFNVALTRAKAKVIVIGNPICLKKSTLWNKYMTLCQDLDTYYGDYEKSESPGINRLSLKINKLLI
ncbi:putative helicase mov-10-B.1 isoform X2 [Battus philenor]|uniref:putative helicase mov-10-B.1 isoform X2 n=1 Tax=Battus philenor TaxID=42288 RepID=UPI0035CE91A3